MTWLSSNRVIQGGILLLWGVYPQSVQSQAGPAPLRLDLPVACDMVRDCSIQKYVDRAAGPDRLDYRCGSITTDGHDGVDFRLRRARDFDLAIPVLAAAGGTVLRTRDEMPDISVTDPAAPAVGNRMAGNAVVIDHGGGWETQYSHLKRGSLRVRPGQKVAAGAEIGAIGMSGNAEFPHLHFELRLNGRTVDPFAPDSVEGCSDGGASLWSAAAASRLPYRRGEVLAAGFVAEPGEALTAHKDITSSRLSNDPDMLILWGSATAVMTGDMQIFRVLAPNGGLFLERRTRIENGALEWVGFAGLKRPSQGWPCGKYDGSFLLSRNGTVVGKTKISTALCRMRSE